MAVRGNILGQQQIVVQVLNPTRAPDGSMMPVWKDVVTTTGKIDPTSANVRERFQQQGMTVTHKVRLASPPTWKPVNSKDKGRLWPGQARFKYTDASGLVRILLYQGSYSPAEAGRWLTVTALEETEQAQFQS